MALQDTTESQKHQEMKESTTDTLSASSDRAVDMSKEDTFPPQDRGKGAWLFLAGASIIEIVAWGWSSYNAYSDYLTDSSKAFPIATAFSEHTFSLIHPLKVSPMLQWQVLFRM